MSYLFRYQVRSGRTGYARVNASTPEAAALKMAARPGVTWSAPYVKPKASFVRTIKKPKSNPN